MKQVSQLQEWSYILCSPLTPSGSPIWKHSDSHYNAKRSTIKWGEQPSHSFASHNYHFKSSSAKESTTRAPLDTLSISIEAWQEIIWQLEIGVIWAAGNVGRKHTNSKHNMDHEKEMTDLTSEWRSWDDPKFVTGKWSFRCGPCRWSSMHWVTMTPRLRQRKIKMTNEDIDGQSKWSKADLVRNLPSQDNL